MKRTILVTGGTGTVGRPVVERLTAQGHDVRALSRRARPGGGVPGTPEPFAVDLRTGEGLDAAVDGVDAIVHCATTYTGGDERSAANLFAAARRAGVPHTVAISIVGCDRVGIGYYRSRARIEQALAASGLGHTVLRATQFHDLVRRLCAGLSRIPVMPVPTMPFQPVDAGEVADRLAELAVGDPVGRAPDLGGPRVEAFRDLARQYAAWSGRRRLMVPVPLPGRAFTAYRAGGHLAENGDRGTVAFADHLAARASASTPPSAASGTGQEG
ncbi:SDR family oxidoreductase [Nocardiopsis mangrovi]|uniref:SDR family oxidoreductase n=1 Tax=Nocardiopsis mangrovi TaxID=1179818 RepID=A0ABV9E4T0_9ACTN